MSNRKANPLAAETIDPSAPLRLDVAAKVAFPDGSMTASGLRRESARGRLILERIANKDYTTLEAIWSMRELCRVQAKEPGFTNGRRDTEMENSSPNPSGLSETAARISPQAALRARLKIWHVALRIDRPMLAASVSHLLALIGSTPPGLVRRFSGYGEYAPFCGIAKPSQSLVRDLGNWYQLTGIANRNNAPVGRFSSTHSRPPWSSIMVRLIDSPMPMPPGLVV